VTRWCGKAINNAAFGNCSAGRSASGALGAGASLRWFHCLQDLPRRDLRALEQHPHGQRGDRSQSAPDVILPDFAKPNPLVTFNKEDIAFVYGTKWKQRYFQKVGDDYYPLGAQWDVTHQLWRAYHVANGTDWWTKFYPDANSARPTGPLCDGCHSVNYNIQNKSGHGMERGLRKMPRSRK
jgi:hypothetical protein